MHVIFLLSSRETYYFNIHMHCHCFLVVNWFWRCCNLRRGIYKMVGRAPQAYVGAPSRVAGPPIRRWSESHTRWVPLTLRWDLPAQGNCRQVRRLPPHHWNVDNTSGAVLYLDGWFPAIWITQGSESESFFYIIHTKSWWHFPVLYHKIRVFELNINQK